MADVFNGQTQQVNPSNVVPQYVGNTPYGYGAVNPYGRYQDWGNPYGQYQSWATTNTSGQFQGVQQPQQQIAQQPVQQSNTTEYILIPTGTPNRMKKYVLVGEVDMQTNAVTPLPSFSLDDVKKTISHEFDIRFGEEKK